MCALKNLPQSPVTGKDKTKLVEKILSSDIVSLYKLQENTDVQKYFQDDFVYILECEETGYRFYYPFELAGDAEFYQSLRNSEYDRDEAEDHKFAYQHINKNDKLVEIGCGTGKFLDQISHITKNVCGLELNSLIAEKAQQKGLDVRAELVEKHLENNREKYDIVCAFQVLEHIPNINSFVKSALELLKPNGKLIFSVPNNQPYFQRFNKYEVLNLPPHHMGLWNLSSLKKLADVFDLDLRDCCYAGKSSFKADVYLRAKSWANIKSLPRRHSFFEKLKIFGITPISVIITSFDRLNQKFGYGHISVVLSKK